MSMVISLADELRLRETQDNYGFAFLTLEYQCQQLVTLREAGVHVRTEPARWWLNKFRYESERLRAALVATRGYRPARKCVEKAYRLSHRTYGSLRAIAGHKTSYDGFVAFYFDEIADAMNSTRILIGSMLPVEFFGQRPEYSNAHLRTPVFI